MARYAGSAQRDLVGLGYRRAVAGTAQEISAVPNLPPPLPAVGTGRQTGRDLACASGGIADARETGAGGGFYRRLLHGGKKGGLAVGPSKRGKGTKILAICTDHSLPLAVGIQSASPHESQLVEEILGQSFLDELPERLIGDAAYDSDPLDDYLLETYDIEADRSSQMQSQTAHPGRSPVPPLSQTLVRGTTLCLAALVSSAGDSLGVSR